MSDEFIINYRPCIYWKLEGVKGHFMFKSKPFPAFGTHMRLKIVYSNSPLNGENTQVLLKNKGESIRVSFLTDVTLKCRKWNDDYFHQETSIDDFSSGAERSIWHKRDEDLKEIRGGVGKSIIWWMQENWFFRIRIYTSDRIPESVPASPAGADLQSLCALSLGQDLSTMFDNPHLSDVTVDCGDRQVPAHRAILAARSKFFEELFREDAKKEPKNMPVRDVALSVPEPVLRYLYTGMLPDLDCKNVRSVCKAAKKFELDYLKLKCADFMSKKSSEKGGRSPKPSTSADAETSKEKAWEKAFLVHSKDIRDLISTLEWKRLSMRNPDLARKALRLLVSESPL